MKNGSLINERRNYRRVKVKAVAFVFQQGKLRGFYQVENLSESGIALGGRSALKKDEVVDLMIQFSGRPGIRFAAQVVHCSENPIDAVYIVGMRFMDLDQTARTAISNVVRSTSKQVPSRQKELAAEGTFPIRLTRVKT